MTDLVDKEAFESAFYSRPDFKLKNGVKPSKRCYSEAELHWYANNLIQAYEQAKLDKASLLGRSAGFKEEINLIFRDSKSETRPKLPTKKAGGAALGGSVCSVAYVTQADFNQIIDYLADKEK